MVYIYLFSPIVFVVYGDEASLLFGSGAYSRGGCGHACFFCAYI